MATRVEVNGDNIEIVHECGACKSIARLHPWDFMNIGNPLCNDERCSRFDEEMSYLRTELIIKGD